MPGDPRTPLPAQNRRLELASTAEGQVLTLHGDWRLPEADSIWRALSAIAPGAPLTIRAGELTGFDSAGALMLLRALDRAGLHASQIRWLDFGPRHARILDGVQRRYAELAAAPADARAERAGPSALAALGRHTMDVGALLHGHLGFFGAAIAGLFRKLSLQHGAGCAADELIDRRTRTQAARRTFDAQVPAERADAMAAAAALAVAVADVFDALVPWLDQQLLQAVRH
jgi:anti-anti-sigma regulatory factor